MNNKAMVFERGMKMVLALASFFLILFVFYEISYTAESEFSEILCKASVLARQFKIEKAGLELNVVPLLCKTLHKDIPDPKAKIKTKDRNKVKEEMARLVAKCWEMFGKGEIPDVFGKNWIFSTDKCFICYSVTINKVNSKDVGLTKDELQIFFDSAPYIYKPNKDQCAIGATGECVKDKCPSYYNEFKQGTCKEENEICCTTNIECLARGGKCADSIDECGTVIKEDGEVVANYSLHPRAYTLWGCDESSVCCINPDDYLAYTDYVQRAGYIEIKPSLFETEKETYGIAYVSDSVTWLSNPDMSAIYISRFDEVKDRCAVQTGSGDD